VRDYAKVAPTFWTGTTGKALRKAGPEAVIVGMYLMTSPHANMIGVYHCPISYISIDTGLTIEGASKGLLSAIEADFCTYDEASEYVLVHEFAAYQVGAELDPKDKRVQGVINELAKVPKNKCWQGFRERYAVPFHLPIPTQPAKPLRSPSKAPSKPEAGTGAEEGTRAEEKTARASRLPADWIPGDEGMAYAEQRGLTNGQALAQLEAFRDWWAAAPGQKGVKADWPATWRTWCRKATEGASKPRKVDQIGAGNFAAVQRFMEKTNG
jgi:hypothetical protein